MPFMLCDSDSPATAAECCLNRGMILDGGPEAAVKDSLGLRGEGGHTSTTAAFATLSPGLVLTF